MINNKASFGNRTDLSHVGAGGETRDAGLKAKDKRGQSSDNFLKYFHLTGNYTYTDAYFDDGIYEDNEIPAVPEHKASGGIAFDWHNINCNVMCNYVGKRRFISDFNNNVDPLDSYLTVDAAASYTYKHIDVFARLNNVFGEEYSEYAVTNAAGTVKNYYPSPERNFQIGVRIKF